MITGELGVQIPGIHWGAVTVQPTVRPPLPPMPRITAWVGQTQRYYDFGPGLDGGIRLSWEWNR